MSDLTSPEAVAERRSRLEELLLTACVPVGGGVRVWSVETPGSLEIHGVIVEPEHRGGWALLRWLRSLPVDRKVVAVRVTDDRLARAFERVGFTPARRYEPERDEWVRIHVRAADAVIRPTSR